MILSNTTSSDETFYNVFYGNKKFSEVLFYFQTIHYYYNAARIPGPIR